MVERGVNVIHCEHCNATLMDQSGVSSCDHYTIDQAEVLAERASIIWDGGDSGYTWDQCVWAAKRDAEG